MIISAGLSIAIFVFLTFVYFGTKFFLVDRNGPPMQTGVIKTVLIMAYLIFKEYYNKIQLFRKKIKKCLKQSYFLHFFLFFCNKSFVTSMIVHTCLTNH